MNEIPASPSTSKLKSAARVIIVGSVMFSFISYWRTAAVVLCDLASTAYYIGAIVESAIGPAAPWFILGVMLFSYAVRSVYIESCALFIRGGVYRVVREALGKFAAKIAVSALIFDYLLTGPISGVSAGQYLVGLAIEGLVAINSDWKPSLDLWRSSLMSWGGVTLCCLVIIYFWRANVRGLHESSDRALKIMFATTVMVVIIVTWCIVTLSMRGLTATYEKDGVTYTHTNTIVYAPDLGKKVPEPGSDKEMPDPLGSGHIKVGGVEAHVPSFRTMFPKVSEDLAPGKVNWLSLIGVIGILIAFGHSILAMSGEETLAQVYREVESPKLPNFRKAAMIVFIYSLIFTGGISLFAVLLIPEPVRLERYEANLISGLVQFMVGPEWLKLLLNAFVVIVGFMILSGAVNTAIIGSNGVLNRVAEDGVMPEWFLKPHPRYGTTHRVLTMIMLMQIGITILSQGDVILLGEAYAFGVVWSFVFQALSMVVLRFKDKRPREYRVPFNLKIGSVEIPFGLLFVLFVLLSCALLNLFTKELATIAGLSFTLFFFAIFYTSEWLHERKMQGKAHVHREQFNQEVADEITAQSLDLTKRYRKLVAIRSPHNLFMLEKALAEMDPRTTELIVMTAKDVPEGDTPEVGPIGFYQDLMTAVVQKAEKAGKEVKPLIVQTNNPLFAVMDMALKLDVQEVILGSSNKIPADEQVEQFLFSWRQVCKAERPLSLRILGRDRDLIFDIDGGNRIPKIGEMQARSVEELRAAVGMHRVLLLVDDDPHMADLFVTTVTMLDPEVELCLASHKDPELVAEFSTRAAKIDRRLVVEKVTGEWGKGLLELAKERDFDMILVRSPLTGGYRGATPDHETDTIPDWLRQLMDYAPCPVSLVTFPGIPDQIVDTTQPAATS